MSPSPPPPPDRPLIQLSDTALSIMLGIALAQIGDESPAYRTGGLAAVIDELTERRTYGRLIAAIDPELAQYIADADYTDRIGVQVAQIGRSTQSRHLRPVTP